MAEHRSDDAELARDLIAQLQNPQWALEQAHIEDKANCDISAGGSIKYPCRLTEGVKHDKKAWNCRTSHDAKR